jgi:hypothetical protein
MMTKIKYIDKITIFSEIKWGFLKQRHQLLSEYLQSEGYEVHFVQKVPSRIPNILEIFELAKKILTQKIKEKYQNINIKPPEIRLHQSIFMPQTNKLFRIYNKYVAAPYYARMAKNGIVYTFTPSVYEIIHKKNSYNFKVVFDIVHNWWEMPWGNLTSRAAAINLLKEADAVICDSQPLGDYLKLNYCKDVNISIVLPGVNESWIKDLKFSRPLTKSSDNDFKILFFGNLRGNSDIELIKSLGLSGAKIDAYGNVTTAIRAYLDGIVEFKGALTQEELLKAVKNYDFTLLPYARDAFSKWISPAKYFEVLALGKPILSRSMLFHMPGWNRLCHNIDINSENSGFIINKKLRNILNKHYEEANHEYASMLASNYTWPKQLGIIKNILSQSRQ